MKVAVLDLGTITTRLLLTSADEVEAGGRGERHVPITHMGAEIDEAGRITDLGLERVSAVLVDHRERLDRFAPDRVRAVATAAARAATNRSDLFQLVTDVIGVDVELLPGVDEGRLAFAGATSGLPSGDPRPCAVIDIGGGSTEFSVGSTDGRLEGVYSAEIGATRVTDIYLEHDPPWASELSAALSVVQLHLDDALRELPGLADALGGGVVLGVGGTITTLASVEIGLEPYDPDRIHGFELDRAAAEDVFRTLATESLADRRHNPGRAADRAPLIVGGAIVFIEAMRHLAIDRVTVSEADLLDGVAMEMLRS